ncbi:amino acid-binding protein [Actinocatenispora sera]|uniref:amino acid-binding protein n=1 Tax=Actinocatenispora sera TaxID=390989 RepID=UPI0033EE0911
MLVRVRVVLPDSPGSLGRLAWTLGVIGADILQVGVLETGSGRAIDELSLRLGSLTVEQLTERVETIPGVRVLAAWRPREMAPAAGLAVLGQLAADPPRAAATLVDAVPDLFGADWAAVVSTGATPTTVLTSVRAPVAPALGPISPARPRAYPLADGTRAALAPLTDDAVLVVARTTGPAFHRTEIDRLDQLARAAAAVLAGTGAPLGPAAGTGAPLAPAIGSGPSSSPAAGASSAPADTGAGPSTPVAGRLDRAG